MDYQIDDLLDEDKCYGHLLGYFHGGTLRCPSCQSTHHHAHESHRKPIVQYKCDDCPTYFNVFSKTVFQGTHWKYSRVMMVLRCFLKGESTNSMSREMGWATTTCYTCATS